MGMVADSTKNLRDITSLIDAHTIKFEEFMKMFEKSMGHKAKGKLVMLVNEDEIEKNEEEKKEEIEDKNESEKVGGWKKAESQEIFDAANAIKDRVEQQAKNDGKAPFEIFETIQGTKQVVAGTNLKIKFKV